MTYQNLTSLPFWSEEHISLRDLFQQRVALSMRQAITGLNRSALIRRIEGPCLTPATYISDAYDDTDLFTTNHVKGGERLILRAETTASSFHVAKRMMKDHGIKPPICIWQAGKSFRTETGDGASANRMRFNEFWQQEFQIIYSAGTKADYRGVCIGAVAKEIERIAGCLTRVVESDRIPAYASSTMDIEGCIDTEVAKAKGKPRHKKKVWREFVSCSIRNDFPMEGIEVTEIAIGLDRVAIAATEWMGWDDSREVLP